MRGGGGFIIVSDATSDPGMNCQTQKKGCRRLSLALQANETRAPHLLTAYTQITAQSAPRDRFAGVREQLSRKWAVRLPSVSVRCVRVCKGVCGCESDIWRR